MATKKKRRAKKTRKWIAGALRGPKGELHRALHVPLGHTIPLPLLRRAEKTGGALGRRARLAETLRGLRHPKKRKKAKRRARKRS